MAKKKRNPDELLRDRALIAEMKFRGMKDEEIVEELQKITGTDVSRRQITYDVNKMRKEWQQSVQANFGAVMQREIERIDATESLIWQTMRDNAADGKTRHTIQKGERGEVEISTVEKAGVDPRFIAQILRCQEERRKLLGLYSPQQVDIHHEVFVKGYVGVSPDDWPDVIEGTVIRG